MLGEKLAELVNFIGEDKAEALSVHSAIESSFHVCYLNRKCLGYAIGLLSWKYDWPARIKSFSKTQCCFPLVLCMFCLFHVFILLKCWHLAANMLLFPKIPLICGLVTSHPQDVVVFILDTASPWIIPERSTASQHTRFILPTIHPTKSIAALHGRYFSFSQIKSYVVVQSSKICF